ncbi:RING-H2 finger protein ATL74-like isoform X1 [Phoenix dactylifera]|uniref:RING-H2 finger protein ATL74-like isoform X1 n=2 Tax=Phoenix dactylifera TaxID=42345 RepID=A0A8B9A2J9_PHODC|nr:RING-H2 finger protein ATL74-like isoform X1 [Phoenix dactylifera]XP_038980831.1 RING-H2 finger protein ATL74-like isoform X1 [Phoenix dactylifera]
MGGEDKSLILGWFTHCRDLGSPGTANSCKKNNQSYITDSMRQLLGAALEAPPPANGSKPRGSAYGGGGSASFDTNMVIILAALLCALICALGLNSIVRCALRCGRRLAFETPEEAAARLAATGLKKRALRRIPVAVYGPGTNIPATDCPICLGEFADGEKVRVLPRCHHGFHVSCIDTWLASHSSCPTCRHSLLDCGGGDGADVGDRSARQDNGVAVVVD